MYQPPSCSEASGNIARTRKKPKKIHEEGWHILVWGGGKQQLAKKYPRISLQSPQDADADQFATTEEQTEAPKTMLSQSKFDFKTLKTDELLKLLCDEVAYKPNLPKRPWKADLLSQILSVAVPRED